MILPTKSDWNLHFLSTKLEALASTNISLGVLRNASDPQEAKKLWQIMEVFFSTSALYTTDQNFASRMEVFEFDKNALLQTKGKKPFSSLP